MGAQPSLPLTADLAARRYGVRPSALVGIDCPWQALYLDAAAALAGERHDAEHSPLAALLTALTGAR